MRNLNLRDLSLVLSVLLIFSSIASASLVPKVVLQNYSISSDPARPGEILNLTLHLRSIEADNCAGELTAQFTTAYPLAIQGSNTRFIGNLCSNDTDEKGTVSVLVPVDSLAQPGTYPVTTVLTYSKYFQTISDSYTVNIRVAGTPSFTASVSSSNPADIYPGDTAFVTVTFANTGTGRAEGAQAVFESGSPAIGLSWAGRTQQLGEIQARGTAPATIAITVPKDTEPGSYPVSAVLTYSGEGGAPGNASFSFSILVKPKAGFGARATLDSPLVSGGNRLVQIALTNTGFQQATNLKVRIMPRFPFSTDGTVRYLDSLAPGETRNVTYTVYVDKDAAEGSQLISLAVDYENPDGTKLSDTADFSLETRAKTFNEQLAEYWYLLALVGIGVLLLAIRKLLGLIRRMMQRGTKQEKG